MARIMITQIHNYEYCVRSRFCSMRCLVQEHIFISFHFKPNGIDKISLCFISVLNSAVPIRLSFISF